MRARIAAVFLLASLAAYGQERTTLDGQPALHFLVGHGHLRTYCDGELWITASRLVFRSANEPAHSFDFQRRAVSSFHTASSLGFDYLKLEAGGRTFRVGVYPSIGRPFGDRFAFVVQAWQDFTAAEAAVQQVEAQRAAAVWPEITAARGPEGAVVRIPVGVARNRLWLPGTKRAPIFDPPDTGSYPRSWVASWGWLEVSAVRIKYIPEKGENPGIDFPRSDYKVIGGARGYPRVVIAQSVSGNQYTILYRSGPGETVNFTNGPGETVSMLDATPLLEVLGDQFEPWAAKLLPKPALIVASQPPGAEILLDAQPAGRTDTSGVLKLENLEARSYLVRVLAQGYEAWSQAIVLAPGERKELKVSMTALPPPIPKDEKKPLSLEEVVQLLSGDVARDRVAKLVSEFGVDFLLSDANEKRLRQAGADDALLIVIAKSKR